MNSHKQQQQTRRELPMSFDGVSVLDSAWMELHATRIEFVDRMRTIKERYVKRSLEEKKEPDQALIDGFKRVEDDFEYKFKQLTMACFFDASFKCCGVDHTTTGPDSSSSPISKVIPNVSSATTTTTMLAMIVNNNNNNRKNSTTYLNDHIHQQRVMSSRNNGSSGANQNLDQDSLSDEEICSSSSLPDKRSMETTEREGGVVPDEQIDLVWLISSGINSNKTAAETSLENERRAQILSNRHMDILNKFPSLSSVSADDQNKLEDEGFFELFGIRREDDENNTAKESCEQQLKNTEVLDEEAEFDRSLTKRIAAAPQSNGKKTLYLTGFTQEMQPKLTYVSPKGTAPCEDDKYARNIRRTELLELINEFIANFGLKAIQRRDPIWNSWFLGEYLQLSKEDRTSGKPLLVLDKTSNASFVEAVTKIYKQCTQQQQNQSLEDEGGGRREELIGTKRRLLSPIPSSLKNLDQDFEDSVKRRKDSTPGASKSQCGTPISLLSPGSGSVVTIQPISYSATAMVE